MKRRFDFPKGARADLQALKARLERQDFGERITRQERALAAHRVATPPSVWARLGRLLRGLSPFNRTWARIEAVEQEIANFRKAVIDVVETECTSLVEVIKGTQGTAATTLEQLSVELEHFSADIAARYDGWLVEYARKFEQTQDQLRKQIESIAADARSDRLRLERALVSLEQRMAEAHPADRPSDRSGRQQEEFEVGSSSHLLLERFLAAYDKRFRPSDEDLKGRLALYRADVRSARQRTGMNGPVIDIRCSGGEFLELLQEDGFRVLGIDSREACLDKARRRGLPVVRARPLEFLKTLEQGSVLVVAGIGVAERLPFSELLGVVQEVARILCPGGSLILETPDPERVAVCRPEFYLEPNRFRPVCYPVLHALLEAAGFNEIVKRPVDDLKQEGESNGRLRANGSLATGRGRAESYAILGTLR